MNDTIRLLNELSVTANTGINALTAIMPQVKNERMKNQLSHQLSIYETFANETGIESKGGMSGGMARMSAKIQARLNSTPSHIAQMMMQGTEMGLIKTQKALNHNKSANNNAKNLAEAMLKFEQNTIDAYRKFL